MERKIKERPIRKGTSAIKFATLFFLCFCSNSFAKTLPNLTIFSETSMIYPLTQITRIYAQRNNVIISVNFNSSFELIQNIDLGEPADVFISSHPGWIETLKQKGLVDVYNLTNIATNKLILITSKNNKKISVDNFKNANSLNDILKIIKTKKLSLIIDSDSTSLGKYTGQIIKDINIPGQIIYRKLTEDKKSVLDTLTDNNDYLGIVFANAVRNNDKFAILAPLPNIEIYYQAVVIAGDNMDVARDFLKFLKSQEAKEILTKEGFVVD